MAWTTFPATAWQLAVARLNATDGSLDATFGTNGIALTPGYFGSDHVLIQSDGKIVVVGTSATARFLTDGTLDSTYGAAGIAAYGGLDGFLQEDGNLVLAVGNLSYWPSDPEFAVRRLLGA